MRVGRIDRTITLMLNDRCPLRCEHCSVGYSDQNKGSEQAMDVPGIQDLVGGIDPRRYDLVILAGGEPTLRPDLVAAAIGACRKTGVACAVSTGPFWARTELSARRFLDSIPPPTVMLLSFDKYHLAFLSVSHYRHAAIACRLRNIEVVLHISYATDDDLRDMLQLADEMRDCVDVRYRKTSRVVPTGNARNLESVLVGGTTIVTGRDLGRIEPSCRIGCAVVNQDYSVHMCCWSNGVEKSPLRMEPTGASGVQAIDEHPLFTVMQAQGLIAGLSAAARDRLAERVKGETFANECHLCATLMERGLLPGVVGHEQSDVLAAEAKS